MRKFILPAVAAALGLAFMLPSHAQASWLSEALHRANGDYYDGGYNYAPGYVAAPDYSYYYSPGVYNYSPPVTYGYSSSYYGAPSYYPYSYDGYSSYGSYPSYRGEWRGGYERGDRYEHGGRYENGGHNDRHDSGNHGRHR